MIDSPLVLEFARRARVSHDHALALLEVLDEIARERHLTGAPPAMAELRPAGPDSREPAPGVSGAWPEAARWKARPEAHDVEACAYVPSPRDVDDLIAAAELHPLGLRFLVEGHLGTVAVAFRTHAFTVDAARQRLKDSGR